MDKEEMLAYLKSEKEKMRAEYESAKRVFDEMTQKEQLAHQGVYRAKEDCYYRFLVICDHLGVK